MDANTSSTNIGTARILTVPNDIVFGTTSMKKIIEQQKSDEALLEALRRDYFYQHFYEWVNL